MTLATLDPDGAPAAVCEAARLAALDRYDILDTPREEAFDRITRLAQKIFRTRMATVTLIDGHRQWFKARIGITEEQTPRSDAICHATIASGAALIIPDTRADPLYAQNPLVVGAPHIRFYAGAPLRTPDGHLIGTLCVLDTEPRAFGEEEREILIDLAQIVIDELELRRIANVDALTGALSRRAFRDEAERALSLAARHKHGFSLVAIDLDNFKAVNDAHGHPAGDAVLARSVAACIKELRKSDFIGRIGGEEFAVVLPHTGARPAFEVAERLREAIAGEVYRANGASFAMTASLGVASSAGEISDLDALLREADTALYLAKAAGRNRCVAARTLAVGADEPSRRRVFKGGQILFNRGRSTVSCTVRTLSDTGAGIDVSSSRGLPDTFDLSIEADGLVRSCRVLSLSDRRVEVTFA